jgi:hypothetical protein
MSTPTTEHRPDSGESFMVYRRCQFGHRVRVARFGGRLGDTTVCPVCIKRRNAFRRELIAEHTSTTEEG